MNKTSKGDKGGASAQPLGPTQNTADWFSDPSGLTNGKTPNSDRKLAPELYDDEAYDESINQTKSQTTKQNLKSNFDPTGDTQPDNRGEQAISGSTPDPTSDDDTLEVAQAMGMQMEEDEEHPQEVNIARDIDLAEENLRQH